MTNSARPTPAHEHGPRDRVRQRQAHGASGDAGAKGLRLIRWFPWVLAMAGIAVYSNCLDVPFIMDDDYAIASNPHVRRWSSLWDAATAPSQAATAGRPLVCLSLALNFAVFGDRLWAYHAVNIAIHVCAAFTLWGIVRRTASAPRSGISRGQTGEVLACATALIWLLHPLQTEAVTYVVQRTELMMGLCYLFTLYASIRAWTSRRPRCWLMASVAACAAGMASKEVMVSAPLIMVLYDRTFWCETWRNAWRARKWFYLALACTWVILLALVLPHPRSESAGFHDRSSVWEYLLTQCWAIPHYLSLSLFPRGLCFDYGAETVQSVAEVWPGSLFVAALLVMTVAGLRRWSPIGLAGAWFFLILAPTSSLLPIFTEPVAERRMYLPLAAVVAVLLAGTFRVATALLTIGNRSETIMRYGLNAALVLVVVALAVSTVLRNEVYRSDVALWRDSVAKSPNNPRGHWNLGVCLLKNGQVDEAIKELRQTAGYRVYDADLYNHLGVALAEHGEYEAAVKEFETALQVSPTYAAVYLNLGRAYVGLRNVEFAIESYQRALRLDPTLADAAFNLGLLSREQGRLDDAEAYFRQAIDAQSNYEAARQQLEVVDDLRRQRDQSLAAFRERLRTHPDDVSTLLKIANLYVQMGELREAETKLREAIHFDSQNAVAHNNLGTTLALAKRFADAKEEYRQALRLDPNYLQAYDSLGTILVEEGAWDEAERVFGQFLQRAPDDRKARARLREIDNARSFGKRRP